MPFVSQGPLHKTKKALCRQRRAHLVSQQEEAGAAKLLVHLQKPLSGGTGAGLVLRAQLITQGLHLPQQSLKVGGERQWSGAPPPPGTSPSPSGAHPSHTNPPGDLRGSPRNTCLWP